MLITVTHIKNCFCVISVIKRYLSAIIHLASLAAFYKSSNFVYFIFKSSTFNHLIISQGVLGSGTGCEVGQGRE